MVLLEKYSEVGGSTNKLMTAGLDRADKMASTFNAAKFALVGNYFLVYSLLIICVG